MIVYMAVLENPKSEPTKSLLNYVESNLRRFVLQGKLQFDIKVVTDSESRPKVFSEVNEFPCMLSSGKVVTGFAKIKQTLESYMSGLSTRNRQDEPSQDDMTKYQQRAILDHDVEEFEDRNSSLQKKISEEIASRKSSKPSSKSNANPLDHYKPPPAAEMDDEDRSLQRFMENQEETSLT
jgi:predicted RNA-binding protein with RPS1 domain